MISLRFRRPREDDTQAVGRHGGLVPLAGAIKISHWGPP